MTFRGRKCLSFNIFFFLFSLSRVPWCYCCWCSSFFSQESCPAWSLVHEQVERPSQQLSAWAHYYTFTWDGASVSMLSLWGCKVLSRLGEIITWFIFTSELGLRLGENVFSTWTSGKVFSTVFCMGSLHIHLGRCKCEYVKFVRL